VKRRFLEPLILLVIGASLLIGIGAYYLLPMKKSYDLHKNRIETIQRKDLVVALEACFKESNAKEADDIDSYHRILGQYRINDANVFGGDVLGIQPKSIVIALGGGDHHFGLITTENGVNPGDPWGHTNPKKNQ
jgi:hypothetical protein